MHFPHEPFYDRILDVQTQNDIRLNWISPKFELKFIVLADWIYRGPMEYSRCYRYKHNWWWRVTMMMKDNGYSTSVVLALLSHEWPVPVNCQTSSIWHVLIMSCCIACAWFSSKPCENRFEQAETEVYRRSSFQGERFRVDARSFVWDRVVDLSHELWRSSWISNNDDDRRWSWSMGQRQEPICLERADKLLTFVNVNGWVIERDERGKSQCCEALFLLLSF